VNIVPREIFNIDEFVRLSEHADYCQVKRVKNVVKLKIRTPKKLYTLKVDPGTAEGVVKRLQCEIREV